MHTHCGGGNFPPSWQWLFPSCQHCCVISILKSWEGLWRNSGKWIGSWLSKQPSTGVGRGWWQWQWGYKKLGLGRGQNASEITQEMVSSLFFCTGSRWVDVVWGWNGQIKVEKGKNSSNHNFILKTLLGLASTSKPALHLELHSILVTWSSYLHWYMKLCGSQNLPSFA